MEMDQGNNFQLNFQTLTLPSIIKWKRQWLNTLSNLRYTSIYVLKDMLLEDMKNMSSIVFEVIRTILGLFIFLWKDFECKKSTKTQKKWFSLSEVFMRTKNCCVCCFSFAYFCFVNWVLLVICFYTLKIFS